MTLFICPVEILQELWTGAKNEKVRAKVNKTVSVTAEDTKQVVTFLCSNEEVDGMVS